MDGQDPSPDLELLRAFDRLVTRSALGYLFAFASFAAFFLATKGFFDPLMPLAPLRPVLKLWRLDLAACLLFLAYDARAVRCPSCGRYIGVFRILSRGARGSRTKLEVCDAERRAFALRRRGEA